MSMPKERWADVPDTRRAIMRANKGKHTKPEITVRKMLHAMGYRFRLHRRNLPGTPDIVFPARCKVIHVHGCFWHQHEGCPYATMPSTRREYWGPKLARNRERDRENDAALTALGWNSVTVWECEILSVVQLSCILQRFLGPPGRAGLRNKSRCSLLEDATSPRMIVAR